MEHPPFLVCPRPVIVPRPDRSAWLRFQTRPGFCMKNQAADYPWVPRDTVCTVSRDAENSSDRAVSSAWVEHGAQRENFSALCLERRNRATATGPLNSRRPNRFDQIVVGTKFNAKGKPCPFRCPRATHQSEIGVKEIRAPGMRQTFPIRPGPEHQYQQTRSKSVPFPWAWLASNCSNSLDVRQQLSANIRNLRAAERSAKVRKLHLPCGCHRPHQQ